jgi:probable phosphoglycerate mutase
MKKLIFVRHWESFANLEWKYWGHSMVKLTEKWQDQAKESSKILVNKNIVKIISSDLERAFSTAKIINIEAKFNLEIEKWEELREVNCWEFTLKNKENGYSIMEIAFKSLEWEKEEDLIFRAKKVIEKIKEIKIKWNILIIWHNSFTATIFYVLEKQNKNISLIEYRKQWNMKNSEIKEFILN